MAVFTLEMDDTSRQITHRMIYPSGVIRKTD